MSSARPNPADAKRSFFRAIQTPGIKVVPKYVASDLYDLRRAYPNDEDFARAIDASAKEILLALRNPQDHGIELEHGLEGWRRSKFPTESGGEATLRLVFRPGAAGIEVLAFGDRDFPDSVYFTAHQRVP